MSQTATPPARTAPPVPGPRIAPPAGIPPPAPPAQTIASNYKWLAASVVILGTIMAILDQTVVNVALPKLETDFDTSLTSIQWVITGYSLALAAVIPLSGWLSDRLGTKWIFVASEILFVVGSALCGLAWSEQALICFRVIQGLGGGLLMPVGMTILMRVTTPDERGRMMAALGVPMMLGPILGPTLGGWLVQDFSWRLIFYINLPIGITGAILSSVILLPDRGDGPRHPLDVIGLVLVSPAVVGIVYGLSQPDTYGWGSWQTLVPLLGGAALLVVFVLFELRQRYPLIEIRVFKDYAFSAAVTVSFLVALSLFGAVFLFPLFLQQIQGYGTLSSGLILSTQGVAAAMMMPISGMLVDRLGARKVVPFGVILLTLASVWTATISYDTTKGVIVLMLMMRGFGMGLVMMPAMSSAYVTMAPQLISRATSVTNVVQRVGSALGVAIMATILSSRISANMPHIPGHTLSGNNTASLATLNLPPALKDLILQQATKGFQDTFWVAAGLGLLCLPVGLLLQRALKPKEVRAYAIEQIESSVLLSAAAKRARDGASGRLDETEANALAAWMARTARAQLEKGRLLLRLGSNGGGLVPRKPASPGLKALIAVAVVVSVVGAALGIARGLQTPSVPDITPLLAQLGHHS